MNTDQTNSNRKNLKERLLALTSTVVIQSDMMPQS